MGLGVMLIHYGFMRSGKQVFVMVPFRSMGMVLQSHSIPWIQLLAKIVIYSVFTFIYILIMHLSIFDIKKYILEM